MRPGVVVAFPALLAALLAACGERPATPPAPSAAQLDKQAIDAATERERDYQANLATGDLPYLGGCKPGAGDSIRLVDIGSTQGYSLAVVPDARGAVAVWQGLQHAGNGKFSAYGPRGMRLDVNGWRQLRQALAEPDFASRAEPIAEPGKVLRRYPETFIAYCIEGRAFLAAAPATPDERLAFERTAVAMRRLAGNYYSPPSSE
jgi:hypothetical protein